MTLPAPNGEEDPRATWATLTPLLGPALLVVGKLMRWLFTYRQEHPKTLPTPKKRS